jgi:hypothetical protein
MGAAIIARRDGTEHRCHQAEKEILHVTIGFHQRFDGALFVGPVVQDADKVPSRFPLLCWHFR